MGLTDEERRRYFRIEDTIGLSYEIVSDSEAKARESELRRKDYSAPNRIHLVERQLQLAIDKLRIHHSEVAEAIDLLNIKFNAMKQELTDEYGSSRNRSSIKKVNISACGVSFHCIEQIEVGEKLDINLKLLPTDLHVLTLGQVVSCHEEVAQDESADDEETAGQWVVSVDFYAMSAEDEELMVQHIVKRQGKLIGASRGII